MKTRSNQERPKIVQKKSKNSPKKAEFKLKITKMKMKCNYQV